MLAILPIWRLVAPQRRRCTGLVSKKRRGSRLKASFIKLRTLLSVFWRVAARPFPRRQSVQVALSQKVFQRVVVGSELGLVMNLQGGLFLSPTLGRWGHSLAATLPKQLAK